MCTSMRFILLIALFAAVPSRAERIVVPVSVIASGANGSLWTTEIRVTNATASDLSFHTVDFVSLPPAESNSFYWRFQPATYTVPAGTIRAFGAYELILPALTDGGCHDLGCTVSAFSPYYGAYEIDLDNGLTLEAAMLTGSAPPPTGFPVLYQCRSWEGGYVPQQGSLACDEGAGPLVRASRTYSPPSAPVNLTWLHTHATRRTNVTFYNPDPVSATVTLTVTSADGLSTVSSPVTVPAHSPVQINDIFSSPPFDAIRAHNGTTTAAARATIVSTTRLYAIGWVISNQNNTVTISEPR